MADFEDTFNALIEKEHEDDSQEAAINDTLAQKLRAMFQEFETLRRPLETEWLENLRQHKGVYDPETLSKIPPNSSKVYPKITRARDNTVLSRLHEMLFPSNDRNWEIEPTPIPKVPDAIKEEIKTALISQDPQTGMIILPTQQQIDQAIKEYAIMSCEQMSAEMEDQLTEMDYSMRVGKPCLKSGVIYGSGIVKGPLPIEYWVTTYEATDDDVVSKETKKVSPYFQQIKIWNIYPDMNVTDWEQQEGCFERHVMSKHELRKLSKRKDFYGDTIKAYLTEHPNGDVTKKNYEMELEKLDQTSAQKNAFSYSESTATQKSVTRKYEVLEYWGYVDGRELQEAGGNVSEDMFDDEVAATIWILGNKIIKAKANGKGIPDIPYLKPFYLEKDETSIFGEGLPRITRHSQITVCAAARMMLNNAAICSGPQFEVNSTLLVNDDPTSIYPMKVWVREGRGADAQYPAIRVYHVESHIEEYLRIVDQFIKFGDIESTLPTWMLSEPSALSNETATGVSMRLSTMTMTVRDIVRNFDEHQECVIKSLYAWNMEFNDNPEIRGDYKVRARGSSSLVMKEVRMQSLNQLVTTIQPEERVYIPWRALLEQRVKTNDLDLSLNTEEQADEIRRSMVDDKAKELAYMQAEADVKKTNAMALNLITKAKKSNNEPPELPAGEAIDPIQKQLEYRKQMTDIVGKEAKMQRETDRYEREMAMQEQDHAANIQGKQAETYATLMNSERKAEPTE